MMSSITLNVLALAAGVKAQWGGWGGYGNNNGEGDGYPGYGGQFGGSGSGSGSGSGDGGAFGPGNFQNGVGFDIQEAMRYRNLHGILAAVAFVGVFPLGSIFMRVIPGRFVWIIHGLTQICAYIIYIVGAALGIYLVQLVRIPPNGTSLLDSARTNTHPIIGLVVLGLILFQPLLGWIHHAKFKRLGKRTWWSHGHIWIGRTMITLGIINGGLGLQLANASQSAITAYAVVAGIMWALWVLSAIYGEIRRRGAAKKTAVAQEPPSPPYTPYAAPVYGGPPPPAPVATQRNVPRHDETEMRDMKPRRSGSVSSLSSDTTRSRR